jgi:hypothetical protein
MDWLKLNKTRFDGLLFANLEPGCWSFFDDTDGPARIGPLYHSRDELLADLHRFACERGFVPHGQPDNFLRLAAE